MELFNVYFIYDTKETVAKDVPAEDLYDTIDKDSKERAEYEDAFSAEELKQLYIIELSL